MEAMIGASNRWTYLPRIWKFRYFWFSLVRLDLQTRYRHSYLGLGWSLIRPLSMTIVLCLVFSQLFQADVREYGPFLLIGLSVWQFLVECATGGCSSFNRASNYIRQQPIPLAIFPLRTVLGAGFHAIISLAVALPLVWIFQGVRGPAALLSLIPTVAILFVFAWSMAIVTGLCYTHFPDTQHLLEIILQILFYLTPIMYRPDLLRARAHSAWLVDWNPLAHCLECVRQPILYGVAPSPLNWLMTLGMAFATGLLAVTALRRLERTLVFLV